MVEPSLWDALGNRYLVVEGELNGDLARALCDGVSDGVLQVTEREGTRAEVRVWNPDGSVAELSGNGARIAARWLAERSGAAEVEILMGGRVLAAAVDGDSVRLDVGRVRVEPDEELDVAGERITLTPVDVGNPHAVVRREPTPEAIRRLGPALELHPRFPRRTNVQLVRVDGSHGLTVAVWERGAGETTSSGSSAVAAAAASVERAWCTSPVTVSLPGGELLVELVDGRATLTGPAVELRSGG